MSPVADPKKKAPAKKSSSKAETGLKKKYGPLPLWGWLIGAVVVYYVYTKSSTSTNATNASTAVTPAAGSTGTGDGSGGSIGSGGGGDSGASGTGAGTPGATGPIIPPGGGGRYRPDPGPLVGPVIGPTPIPTPVIATTPTGTSSNSYTTPGGGTLVVPAPNGDEPASYYAVGSVNPTLQGGGTSAAGTDISVATATQAVQAGTVSPEVALQSEVSASNETPAQRHAQEVSNQSLRAAAKAQK